MGLKTISLYDQGFYRADRGNNGYIDGKNFERKRIKMTSGNVSHKEFSDMAARYGVTIGRTPITNSLAPGTMDASPVPSDSLCYQQKRLLVKSMSATDTMIYVNDPKLMHFTYLRYLENQIREEYGFVGTPIRLVMKGRRE